MRGLVDYIRPQLPQKGAALWNAEVTKMVAVFHVPIKDAEAKAIAAYLTATY